jgi:subfamily B ATP-binding cassette protein MsbA
MIKVGESFRKKIQKDLFSSLINADTQSIDEKHSGEFISNITHDVNYCKWSCNSSFAKLL